MFNKGCFCDTIGVMRNKISFLAAIIAAFGISTVNASDCTDDGCDLYEFIEDYSDDSDYLFPKQFNQDIWSEETSCDIDYNCPFETEQECEVWNKKPVHSQSVSPRAPHLNLVRTDEILYAIYTNDEFSANDPAAEPLLARYNMLIRASKSCCIEGIVYKMHENKATDKQVYQFLKDDANYFGIGTRCLVTTNDEIQNKYSNGVNADMVMDVRNSCLCKNRKWFDSLLEPFNDVYKMAPEFESQPFNYTYTDGLQRQITVSINEDVQNTMNLLENCPD